MTFKPAAVALFNAAGGGGGVAGTVTFEMIVALPGIPDKAVSVAPAPWVKVTVLKTVVGDEVTVDTIACPATV